MLMGHGMIWYGQRGITCIWNLGEAGGRCPKRDSNMVLCSLRVLLLLMLSLNAVVCNGQSSPGHIYDYGPGQVNQAKRYDIHNNRLSRYLRKGSSRTK